MANTCKHNINFRANFTHQVLLQLLFQWVISFFFLSLFSFFLTALNGPTRMSEYTDVLLPKTKKQSALNMHDFIKQNIETGDKDGKHMAMKAGST